MLLFARESSNKEVNFFLQCVTCWREPEPTFLVVPVHDGECEKATIAMHSKRNLDHGGQVVKEKQPWPFIIHTRHQHVHILWSLKQESNMEVTHADEYSYKNSKKHYKHPDKYAHIINICLGSNSPGAEV